MTTYFASVAGDLERSVKRLPSAETSGIVWNEDTVVTARLEWRMPEGVTVTTAEQDVRAQSVVGGPHLPLMGIQISGTSDLVPARRRASPAQAGDWVVAVWHTGSEPAFAPGTYVERAPVSCGERRGDAIVSTVSLTRTMAGGGLFDIDGSLLAVIVPCDGRFAALSVPSVDDMLDHAATSGARLLARYGLAVDSLTEAEKDHFKSAEGVIVRDVWIGYPAEKAGLMPGDIVHGLDGRPVLAPGDLQALITASDPRSVLLRVQRGSRQSEIVLERDDVDAESIKPAIGSAGLVWEPVQEGYRIESVLPGSPAAQAGIRPGDRLLRINQVEPRSLGQVRRLLSAAQALPAFVEIRRGGRRWGTLMSQVARTHG